MGEIRFTKRVAPCRLSGLSWLAARLVCANLHTDQLLINEPIIAGMVPGASVSLPLTTVCSTFHQITSRAYPHLPSFSLTFFSARQIIQFTEDSQDYTFSQINRIRKSLRKRESRRSTFSANTSRPISGQTA